MFTFAEYAKKMYQTDDIKLKRTIIRSLGSNLTLKDKKLEIEKDYDENIPIIEGFESKLNQVFVNHWHSEVWIPNFEKNFLNVYTKIIIFIYYQLIRCANIRYF